MSEDRDEALAALRAAWREHIDHETPFKIQAAEQLRDVLEQVVDRRADWTDFLKVKRSFLNNQLGRWALRDFVQLTSDHPEALRAAADSVLAGGGAEGFFRALEDAGADLGDYATLRGDGGRAALASFFLLLWDPKAHPIYRAQNTGDPLAQLLGRPINVGGPEERLERYYQGLDDLAPLLADGDAAPRHRLDVQGALWIAKGYDLGILDDGRGGDDEQDGGAPEREPHPASKLGQLGTTTVADRLEDPDVRIVKVAPGHRASEWEDCHAGGYVCVGWDDVGDVGAFDSFEEFIERFREAHPYNGSMSTSSRKGRELWTFTSLREGDLVVANRGISEILGIGVVTSEKYCFREDRESYRHTVSVAWDTSYATQIPRKPGWAIVTVAPVDRSTLDVILGTRESYRRTWSLRVDRLPPQAPRPPRDATEGDAVRMEVDAGVDEIRAGDRVLVWDMDEEPSLYAIAHLAADPAPVPSMNGAKTWSINLGIDTLLTEPLQAAVFAAEPSLASLDALDGESAAVTTVEARQWKRIFELLEGEEPPKPPSPRARPAHIALADLEETSGIPRPELERWVRSLDRKGQAILYGPPGTGKTFVARLLADHLAGGHDGFVDLVQFHPAYAYEDFVQGLRPVSQDRKLSYEMVPGRLLEFLEAARGASGPCVLILDEINRADLARVFGELMYLLEYRDAEVPLAGGGRLSIPSNVRLIGTMNTADRSIALVDHALRRRFAFLRLQPKLDVLVRYHSDGPEAALARSISKVLDDLHGEIDDPNLAIGISYFLVDDLAGTVEDVWRMEIEPYLEELFFDRANPLGRFAWSDVARRLGLA